MKRNHTWFMLALEARRVLRVLILGIKEPQMAQVSEDRAPSLTQTLRKHK